MESLIGKDRPDKDAEAVILTKYIVSPDRGLDFIKAFKLVSTSVMLCRVCPASKYSVILFCTRGLLSSNCGVRYQN